MMYLRTLPERLTAGHYAVHWTVGRKRGGSVTVSLSPELEDAELIAELCAMRYLLLDKRVFNVSPTSGKGYCLQVSTGAIRKLVLRKSTKSAAFPYAAFLSSRMHGAKIEVISKTEPILFDDAPVLEQEHISPDPDVYASANEAIDTPAMGKVFVTAHAVQRYIERNISGDSKNPWLTLTRRLQHPELKILPIPDKHLNHKRRKYGESNQVETWGHANSSLAYVIVNDGSCRVVVTVFRRSTAA